MLGEGCYQSQCGILASNLRGIENQNLASSGFGFHLLVYAWDGCLGWVKSQIR